MRIIRIILASLLASLVLIILLGGLSFAFIEFESLKKLEPEPASQLASEVNPIEKEAPLENIGEAPGVETDDSYSLPGIIKAIYLTSWSASRKDIVDYVIEMASTTEMNGVVIDIKDFSGYIAYDTALVEVEEYQAEQIRIRNIKSLIQELQGKGIYVIARITVFQDPILAQARPDLAVLSKAELASETSTSPLWLDKSGLAWIDPAAPEAWKYNAEIAKEAARLGFDELNFDYVRFPSDGDLDDMSFSVWNGTTSRHLIIKDFFKYLRQELPDTKLSVDLFGLATVGLDDLGIGQIIEDAYEYFDFVCPMVYPSHYAPGFQGYPEPTKYPYEVVRHSMEGALRRLEAFQPQERDVYLRPWLQDFDLLGVPYDAEMVKAEIRGLADALGDNFQGFMLWNSWNVYTKEALQPSLEEATSSVPPKEVTSSVPF